MEKPMAKKTEKKSKGFDYKGYVSNLGKVGTFYKDKKDSKGVEGTLVAIQEKGVYAKVKGDMFPRLFARADFGTTGTVKCSCGKTFRLVEVKGSSKKGKGKDSDNDSYGDFGKNGKKKAGATISYLNKIKDLDQHDDDDWDTIVELTKKLGKNFSK